MAAFKIPDFNERTAAAREARQRALDNLKAKPAPDPEVLAARQAAYEAREAAQAEKREARQAALREAREAREEAQRLKEETAKKAAEATKRPLPTAAELKAARDARYAARKSRVR